MPRTILLADDSATIRKIVELTFSDTEVRVESVSNGQDAMARLDSVQPDLLLVDVAMPEPTGYEVCRAVKESGRPVPVVLLAGTFEPIDEDLSRRCGADAHIVKPFESRALVELVERLLAVPPGASKRPESDAASAATAGKRSPAEILAEALDPELSPELVDAVARRVVERLSEDVVREIAREVIPEVASAVVRERIRELEQEES